MTPMSSMGYNRVREAQLEYEKRLDEELAAAGWTKVWRKKNGFTYWVKNMPMEGMVTATTREDALKWEYEL
jgi:hypothetical protein